MKLLTRLAAAFVSVFAVTGSVQAEYAPPGTYQRTCSDITATWNVLSATCRTRSGSWNYTTLRNYRDCDGDIANRNGRLECSYRDDDDRPDDNYGGWLPMGSYRSSCRNITIERGTLMAECRDNFGRWRYTELAGYRSCRDIVNVNGILQCRRDDGDDGYPDDDTDDGRLPGGSWRYSCQNGRVNEWVLHATCRDSTGSWRRTSLDLRYCRGNVANDNGRLVCSSGGAGGSGYGRITLYRHTNYAGRSRMFTTNVPDLSPYGFSNLTSSVVIQGGVWQLCDKPNYRGYCIILDRSQGNLWAFGFNDRTESLRRIR
jgi:hypothetical protein